MARRADHTREELKELAIKAGLEVLKQEGLARFSARKVAARIGYTVGTLFNVFGSCDDLIVHINARTLDEWYAFMQQRLSKSRSPNPLLALGHAYIEYSKAHYNQWIALFEHHMSAERTIPDWYAAKMSRFFILTEELLLCVVPCDRKKAGRAARVLWAGIHGICILALSGKLDIVGAASPDVLAESFIEHYVAGLKSAP